MKKVMTAAVFMGLFFSSQAISTRALSAQGVQVVVSAPQPVIVVARPQPVIVVAPQPVIVETPRTRVVYVKKRHHDNGRHGH